MYGRWSRNCRRRADGRGNWRKWRSFRPTLRIVWLRYWSVQGARRRLRGMPRADWMLPRTALSCWRRGWRNVSSRLRMVWTLDMGAWGSIVNVWRISFRSCGTGRRQLRQSCRRSCVTSVRAGTSTKWRLRTCRCLSRKLWPDGSGSWMTQGRMRDRKIEDLKKSEEPDALALEDQEGALRTLRNRRLESERLQAQVERLEEQRRVAALRQAERRHAVVPAAVSWLLGILAALVVVGGISLLVSGYASGLALIVGLASVMVGPRTEIGNH